MPANWALYPDDPSSATSGVDDACGVAAKRVHIPPSPRLSPSMPITSITSRGKCSHALVRVAAERRRRHRVGAGRAADAEIDPPGVERLEHRKLLGDRERGVIGQHHAAGSDADALGGAGEMGDQDGWRGAGDGRHVVVLGDPEADVAELLGGLCQARRVGQRLGRGAARRGQRPDRAPTARPCRSR